MATAAENDDGIGLGGLQGGAALPRGLQPAPEALAHQPQGKKPKQQGSGDYRPAPAADQTHHQQDKTKSHRQQGRGEELA